MDQSTMADRMIGESASFLLMQEHVSQAAPLDKPVLIIGERGTGKELVAARLHYLSGRWAQPFIKVNCSAFHENLLESQLFGHEPGAFTGAGKQYKGCFERADGGTLFLDEIANTSMTVQEKILRVTEYGEIERLGGNRPHKVAVRVVAATNLDLPRLARAGRFREDLLDRLAFDVITLPPLRERPEDIAVLAEHFAVRMTRELEREFFAGFSAQAAKKLREYPWPGNVRELKNVVERSVYKAEAPDKPIKHIIFDPFESPYRPGMPPAVSAGSPDMATPGDHARAAPALDHHKGFKQQVRDYEKSLLHQALEQCRFNQRQTANLLGLTYDQLRGYLRKYEF